MYMIFFVLDDPNRLDALLEKWETVGITGVTIIESTGIHRVLHQFVPMRYFFGTTQKEEGHYSLFAIVPDEATVQKGLAAAEDLVGDLTAADTGVFAAWPLAIVKGLPNQIQEG